MKLYDISQEVFECSTYLSDPVPKRNVVSSMSDGALYNLTEFSMCAHNGTHIDAPAHFIKDGKTIDQIPLEQTVGLAYVYTFNGSIDSNVANKIMQKAKSECLDNIKIILIKGRASVTFDGAQVFARSGITLLGCEFQSIATQEFVASVHRLLLDNDVLLLEGLRLEAVEQGKYFLCAAPLNLGKAEGAPCRAFLIDLKDRNF